GGVLGTTDYSTLKADQLSVGYVHDLSKRTALYSTLSYLKNRGSARYSVASITNATTAAGDSSRGIDVGIRHSF
ncbi:MAG: porin, partial [Comamonas sp.]